MTDKYINTKIGSWTVLEYYDSKYYYNSVCKRYKVKCDCGKTRIRFIGSLLTGKSTNCGCKCYKLNYLQKRIIKNYPVYRGYIVDLAKMFNVSKQRIHQIIKYDNTVNTSTNSIFDNNCYDKAIDILTSYL